VQLEWLLDKKLKPIQKSLKWLEEEFWNYYLQTILWTVQFVIKEENVIFKINILAMDFILEDLVNSKEQ
jgi:hypothetical protein